MTLITQVLIVSLSSCLVVSFFTPEKRLRLAILLTFLAGGTGQLPSGSATAIRALAIIAAIGAVIGLRGRAILSPKVGLGALALGLTCMLAVPFIAHRTANEFAGSLIGTSLILLLSAAAKRSQTQDIIRSFNIGVWAIIAASTPLVAVPSLGMAGSNFRGVTANANSLGIYCLLATASALFLLKQRGLIAVILVSWPVCLCVMSHSRTSLICIALLLACAVAERGNTGRKFAAAGIIATTLALVARPSLLNYAFGGVANKTRGTRNLSLAEARRAWETDKLYGLGPADIHFEIASSPLRALAEGGLAMLSLYIAACLIIVLKGIKSGSKSRIIAVIAVVHALGEGWLISTTGPWILAFCCAFMAFIASDQENEQRGSSDAPFTD